ncbi:RNA-binding S4 domain-containing protein [Parabacteroides acidifaciens]|uniref:Pseudouridine synthase n=1 Tax=Parabacteroides acidifaciens TaxID=2290935 RepID=A0A3D8HEU2_9BACT|nr:pseudouridine synthase [Parabacteroides acidifaciens]MBC8601892.1 RNA-binding S4 domain-containing protein [Parabacteroides acidifaciens]RDU49456.1 pseudouridine synthase [Parabacteroides acidifaciens]
MSTEERDESQPRPRKVIPSIRRENTDQDSERRPYNQGYNRPEGNNYERRPYNRPTRDDRGGYNSYGDNRSSYGDRPSRPRTYDNREGGGYNKPYNRDNGGNRGYGNNREGGYNNRPSYGNNRPSYGNDRPSYGNDRSYGGDRPSYGDRPYNRPTRPSNYEDRGKAYSATPAGEGVSGDGVKKRRPRVGDTRVSSPYDNRDNRGGRPSYGNNRPYGNNGGGGRGGYNNNRRPNNNRRTGDYNPNAKYNFQKQLKYKEVLADPNEPIRLNKFLSNAGVCSRREADEFIQAGAVKVNDVVVTELGTKITRQDKVLFNEQPVQIESKVYIVLNKPKNCVTTSDDPQERLTVMDLVKNACQERIYPVGRLDRNTTGVLLLTNDGDLASKLTHPSFKKKKIYHVWLDKNVSIEDMEKIANGLELEDGEIHADAISYASEEDKSQVGIEIHSGRNRIVRRIFESLGYHVIKLDRVYFAGLTKKNLGRGKWRYLNEREVNALRMGAFE